MMTERQIDKMIDIINELMMSPLADELDENAFDEALAVLATERVAAQARRKRYANKECPELTTSRRLQF